VRRIEPDQSQELFEEARDIMAETLKHDPRAEALQHQQRSIDDRIRDRLEHEDDDFYDE